MTAYIIPGPFPMISILKSTILSLPKGNDLAGEINRLLTDNCNFNIGNMNNDDTTSIICFGPGSNINSINYEDLIGYFEIKTNNNFPGQSELYTVCRFIKNYKYQGRGYMEKCLRQFLESFKNMNQDVMWLGVILDNTDNINIKQSLTASEIKAMDTKRFHSAIKMYARLGFDSPQLSNRTLFGDDPGFTFIEMFLNFDDEQEDFDEISETRLRSIQKENTPTKRQVNYISDDKIVPSDIVENIVEECLRLRDDYLNSEEKCKVTVYLSKNVCDKLQSYLWLDQEVAGSLYVTQYITNPDDPDDPKKYAQLGISQSKMEIAVDPPCGVFIPMESNFSFHTHPFNCYYLANCIIGWPSGDDFGSYTSNINQYINFLVSAEGIYCIHLHPDFFSYLDNQSIGMRKLLAGKITVYMRRIEDQRSLTCPIKKQQTLFKHDGQINLEIINYIRKDIGYQSQVNQYLELIKKIRITDIVDTGDDLDFTMFIVNLHIWEKIEEYDGLLEETQYREKYCGLPIQDQFIPDIII